MTTNMENEVPLIKLENVVRKYYVGSSTIHALDGVNLTVYPGEFVVIMGPSGSGKSTLLNVIAGLEKPTSGKVYIKGQDLTKLSDDELADIRRHLLGFIFQFFNLHPSLTALENVELPMLIAGVPKKQRTPRAMELLKLVHLEERANHYPHELSGGEKQRVGIARALANDPPLILGDEPTGDLDSATGKEIIDYLIKLNREQGKTLVIVTHDESFVDPTVMRLLRMEDGQIMEDIGVKTENIEATPTIRSEK